MSFTGHLTGRIGAIKELRSFESGKSKLEIPIAVRRPKSQDTLWVQVDLWNEQAVYAVDNYKKGESVYVTGTVDIEQFDKRDGSPGLKIVLKYGRIERFFEPTSNAQQSEPARQQTVEVKASNATQTLQDAEVPMTWEKIEKPSTDEIPF